MQSVGLCLPAPPAHNSRLGNFETLVHGVATSVSIRLMQPGARDDGWHTDGGCPLLHASVTFFGTLPVEVKVEGKPQVTFDQEPGSFLRGGPVRPGAQCAPPRRAQPHLRESGCNSKGRRKRVSRRLQKQRATPRTLRQLKQPRATKCCRSPS